MAAGLISSEALLNTNYVPRSQREYVSELRYKLKFLWLLSQIFFFYSIATSKESFRVEHNCNLTSEIKMEYVYNLVIKIHMRV